MQDFSYIAVSANGAEQKGTLSALSPEQVAAELKSRGLTPLRITAPSILSRDVEIGFLKKRPKARDLSVFCRQFVSILNAGVPVVAALEMLSEQTENKILANAITEIRLAVEIGDSLTSAMNTHVDIFGSMLISLVAAGEASGSLPNSFSRMADQYEKDARLRGMMKKATIYPMVILIVTIVVVAAMLVFVVPTFQSIFDELGTSLPALTQFVVAASRFMTSYWYIVFAVAIAVVMSLKAFSKKTLGKQFFSALTLRLPVFKKFVVKTSSAKMGRTLSTLMGSGIPLIESLEITAQTMTNMRFMDELENAKSDVAMGTPLSESLRSGRLFPALVYQMLNIGEESGSSEQMLTKIADYFEEEAEQSMQQLMALLEPAIIVIMAVFVGTIIMAVMLPMFQLFSSIGNM